MVALVYVFELVFFGVLPFVFMEFHQMRQTILTRHNQPSLLNPTGNLQLMQPVLSLLQLPLKPPPIPNQQLLPIASYFKQYQLEFFDVLGLSLELFECVQAVFFCELAVRWGLGGGEEGFWGWVRVGG